MSRADANNILDLARCGVDVRESLVMAALEVTGDISGATDENAGAVAFHAMADVLEAA